MKIVTSFSLDRPERRRYCLESWRKYGLEIVAVQLPEHADFVRQNFDGVTVVEDPRGGKPYGLFDAVRVKAIFEQATDGPILIVNSDISIKDSPEKFNHDWLAVDDDEFRFGVRWDRDADGTKSLNRYGIDVFRLSKSQAAALPDIGFCIGSDVWDYWIVWHLMRQNLRIRTMTDCRLIHAKHEKTRSEDHRAASVAIFERRHGITERQLSSIILAVTGRSDRKKVDAAKYPSQDD